MTESPDLSAKQYRAIAALMSSKTIADAAQQIGVHERTLYGWLSEAAFTAAYMAARREAVASAIARLQAASSGAVDRLEHLLTCGKPAIELGAARSILEFSIKALELEDLAARIAALEAKYGS